MWIGACPSTCKLMPCSLRVTSTASLSTVFASSAAAAAISAASRRDPKSEQLLQQAEDDLVAGQKRINELAAHIGHMGRVLDCLKQK